jgi:hypothetical protein
MSLSCTLFRASDRDIERLASDLGTLVDFVESIEGRAPPMQEFRPKGLLGLVLRVTPIKIFDPVSEETNARVPDPDHYLDVGDAWHGLHFLLTGTAAEGEEPACYLASGGDALDEDGQFRALRSDQVRLFANHLSRIGQVELERRFDSTLMRELEIYPESAWGQPASSDDTSLRWLIAVYAKLSAFIIKAVAAGDGVVIRIA